MADTKITALTALTAADPANDVIPIVDVNDTIMAGSGTTKKISINNILGASGTATLASATITGDLTVDTNVLKVDTSLNRVGVVTATPRVSLDVASGDIYSSGQITWGGSSPTANQGFLSFTGGNAVIGSTGATALLLYTNGVERYNIGSTGISTWSVGGTTAMTLNSTGLGVGASPNAKLTVYGGGATTSTVNFSGGSAGSDNATIASNYNLNFQVDANNTIGGRAFIWRYGGKGYSDGTHLMTLDASGNVGIGVTPKSWLSSYKAIQLGYSTSLSSTTGTDFAGLSSNAYVDSVDSRWERIVSGYATQYYQNAGDGQHIWRIAGTAAADTAITWTQAMTLDASGNLLVGKTATNLQVVGCELKADGTVFSTLVDTTNAAASSYQLYSTGAATYRFYVGLGGTVFATNTTISAISDARLKENVQDIDVGLGAILALKPRKFDWKAGKGKDIKGDRGFIAQEFEQVFPNLIDEWKDAAPEGEAPYKSVRQDLIPVLVKAIQELAAEVNALKNA